MAGAMFTENSLAMEPSGRNSQISEFMDQMQVQYARHIDQMPFSRNRLGGSWISTDAASLKLKYQRSSSGKDDAVVCISVRDRVFEEHYISNLRFSWPQVVCMSGFPARGSRTIMLSYKDCIGQIQKFVLRFLTIYETEKFMTVVKDTLESVIPEQAQFLEYNSQWSSQAEVVPSGPAYKPNADWLSTTSASTITVKDTLESVIPEQVQSLECTQCSSQAEVVSSAGPAYKPNADWQSTTSANTMTPLILSSSASNSAQDRVIYEKPKNHEVGDALPVFPPSFMQLLKSCEPEVSQDKPAISGDDLKNQFMRYLGGTSFKELLATVESVLGELGDDIAF